LWSIQILKGLDFLHNLKINNQEKGIIHRDIKPANIYLNENHLVIGDLGHAKSLDTMLPNASNSNRAFGTNNYMAPEAYNTKRTIKMDIWSFGCILFELFNLEKLFYQKTLKKLLDAIEDFNVNDLNVSNIKPEKYVRALQK
jgi:eukaryotic-like serine/threonine-protein kinase